MTKTITLGVRFTAEEASAVRKFVKESGGTISDFVRFSVNTQMAQSGGRENEKLLADMIARGMKKTLTRMVEYERKKRA